MLVKDLSPLIGKDVDFSLYRLPNGLATHFIAQSAQNRKSSFDVSSDKGFVIHPFDNNSVTHSPVVIQPQYFGSLENLTFESIESLIISAQKVDLPKKLPNVYSEDEYLSMLSSGINEMVNQKIDKFIFSRVQITPNSINPFELFEKLSIQYPKAFVYFFQISGVGCWMGATPEILAENINDQFTTFSLAGTQKKKPNTDLNAYHWGDKEKDEQAYVTEFIASTFEEFGLEYTINGPMTHEAGPVVHLLSTLLSTDTHLNNCLTDLINRLHPTPAVCGLPKEKAFDFIQKVENHSRGYYTGYLGPVGLHDQLQLFVNLRCMEVFENCLALYLGGGITKDSIPKNEWQETCDKAQTLLSVI